MNVKYMVCGLRGTFDIQEVGKTYTDGLKVRVFESNSNTAEKICALLNGELPTRETVDGLTIRALRAEQCVAVQSADINGLLKALKVAEADVSQHKKALLEVQAKHEAASTRVDVLSKCVQQLLDEQVRDGYLAAQLRPAPHGPVTDAVVSKAIAEICRRLQHSGQERI